MFKCTVITGCLGCFDYLSKLVGLFQMYDGGEGLEGGSFDLRKRRNQRYAGKLIFDRENVDQLFDQSIVKQIVGVLLDCARVYQDGQGLEASLHKQFALFVVGK